MKKVNLRPLTEGAMIAAVYAVLTLFFWQFSSMQIQVRISEAMCILPLFTYAAVPGLTAGCFLINLIMGNPWDAVFGSLATFLAALMTYLLGKIGKKWAYAIAPMAPVLFNAMIIPPVLYFGYGITAFGNTVGLWSVLGFQALSIAIGEIIACYGMGIPLYLLIKRTKLFKQSR